MNAEDHGIEIASRSFLRDVVYGLSQSNKELQCKYFYDERGSKLFDQICELDEYYLTRTEQQIMLDHADEMAAQLGSGVMLIEFGSGSSTKSRVLLDALIDPVAYVPLDISEEHLLKTAAQLASAYPDLEILPLVADFTQPFVLPRAVRKHSHAAVYFPGSTIGNFVPEAAARLIQRITGILGPQGGLLIGIDLQKERTTIEAAYNDSMGVTEEFNLNVLHRVNRELGADFDVEQFRHRAIYNAVAGRVEISVVSNINQVVTVDGHQFAFQAGEQMLTEYSHKYTIDGFATLAARAGLNLHKCWTDDRQLFAVLHLVNDSE